MIARQCTCEHCRWLAQKSTARKAARKAYRKAYHRANREKINAKSHAWYCTNADRARAVNAAYRAKHQEEIQVWRREYYKVNKKAHNRRARAWAINNPLKRKITSDRSAYRMSAMLLDSYVKQLIKQALPVKALDIPQQLIEAKRQHLRLQRLIREKQQ